MIELEFTLQKYVSIKKQYAYYPYRISSLHQYLFHTLINIRNAIIH
jgi:hypothetical protein